MSESIGFVLDPHIDSIETVLEIRARALKLFSEGKSIMEWTGEGTSVKKAFVLPIADVLRETTRFLKAADPITYGYPLTTKKIFRT